MSGLYTNVLEMPVVTKIIETAELEILAKTGVEVKLMGHKSQDELTKHAQKILLRKLVCDMYDCTWDGILSLCKKTDLKDGRHAYIYLLFTMFKGETKASISKELNKEHASIIHAINKINGYYQVQDDAIIKIEKIKKQFYAYIQNDNQPPVTGGAE